MENHLTDNLRYKNSTTSKTTVAQDLREETREITLAMREEALIITRRTSEKIIKDSMPENSNLNIIYSSVSKLIIMSL